MVYVFLADGFEIIEAMSPIDMLRRADVGVTTVGVDSKVVTSSCSIPVTADITSAEFEFVDVEAVIIPGGGQGVINLEKSSFVQSVIDKAVQCGAIICAICAGPSILGHKGLLKEKMQSAIPVLRMLWRVHLFPMITLLPTAITLQQREQAYRLNLVLKLSKNLSEKKPRKR